MLSTAVFKDPLEYKPKLIFKMTTRTLVSVAGAIGSSVVVGLYIHYVLGLATSDFNYLIYAASIPFWCIGFITPKKLPFEQWLVLWLRHRFSQTTLFYVSTFTKCDLVDRKESIHGRQYRRFSKLRSRELYRPTVQSIRN
jgi:hypothetical protein